MGGWYQVRKRGHGGAIGAYQGKNEGLPRLPCVRLYLSQQLAHDVFKCTASRIALTRSTYMYTVSIQWGSKAVTHTAWSLSSAKQWLLSYPNKDMFGKVTDMFGNTLAVRYYR